MLFLRHLSARTGKCLPPRPVAPGLRRLYSTTTTTTSTTSEEAEITAEDAFKPLETSQPTTAELSSESDVATLDTTKTQTPPFTINDSGVIVWETVKKPLIRRVFSLDSPSSLDGDPSKTRIYNAVFPPRIDKSKSRAFYTLPCSEDLPVAIEWAIYKTRLSLERRDGDVVHLPESIYSFGAQGERFVSRIDAINEALILSEIYMTELDTSAMFLSPVGSPRLSRILTARLRCDEAHGKFIALKEEIKRVEEQLPRDELDKLLLVRARERHNVDRLEAIRKDLLSKATLGSAYIGPRAWYHRKVNKHRLDSKFQALEMLKVPGDPVPVRLKFMMVEELLHLMDLEIVDCRESMYRFIIAKGALEKLNPLPDSYWAFSWKERIIWSVRNILDTAGDGDQGSSGLTYIHRPLKASVPFWTTIPRAIHEMNTEKLSPLIADREQSKSGQGPYITLREYCLILNLFELLTNASPEGLRPYQGLKKSTKPISRVQFKKLMSQQFIHIGTGSPLAMSLEKALSRQGIRRSHQLLQDNMELLLGTPRPPPGSEQPDRVAYYRPYLHPICFMDRPYVIENLISTGDYNLYNIEHKLDSVRNAILKRRQSPIDGPSAIETSLMRRDRLKSEGIGAGFIRKGTFLKNIAREFSTSSRTGAAAAVVGPSLVDDEESIRLASDRLLPAAGIRALMRKKEALYMKEMNLAVNREQALRSVIDENDGSDIGDSLQDGTEYEAYELGNNEPGEMANFKGVQALKKGDLCELRFQNGGIEMAVFLRNNKVGDGTADFLTVNGVVKKFPTPRVTFYIESFVPAASLEDFLDYFDRLDKFHESRGVNTENPEEVLIARAVTGPLLHPVKQFVRDAGELFAKKQEQFGSLYLKLAKQDEVTTVTLAQAAEMCFRGTKGPIDLQLYATHMALMGDGLRFMCDKGFHRATKVFSIRSTKDLGTIDSVTEWIRRILNNSPQEGAKGRDGKRAKPALRRKTVGNKTLLEEAVEHPEFSGPLKAFIEKTKPLIDESRKLRVLDRTGRAAAQRIELHGQRWTEADLLFINYVKFRLMSYGLQPTPVEGLVPYILRQTERYAVEDAKMDAATAYVFLGEIGVFSPWENLSLLQQNQRLPGYGVSADADAEQARYDAIAGDTFEQLKTREGLVDSLAHLRKDWGPMQVFTVDEASAHEIDDGVSVEAANEHETWVHVHIANPTAFLTPTHWISRIAQSRGVTKYLSPYTFPMLPQPLGKGLSVSDNHPVLTFSARIGNDSGDILESAITPGIVRSVTKVTYRQLDRILAIPEPETFTVSTGPQPPTAPDPPLALSAAQEADLRLFHKTALTLMRRRVRAGMIHIKQPTFTTTLHGAATPAYAATPPSPVLYSNYPGIRLTVSSPQRTPSATLLIAEAMLLAGSITAATRLPLPYRVVVPNPDNPAIVTHYYEKILPRRNEYGDPGATVGELGAYLLVGRSELRTTPGPQILLGLSGYVKSTSPLRRWADCTVHWNLQAKILALGGPIVSGPIESSTTTTSSSSISSSSSSSSSFSSSTSLVPTPGKKEVEPPFPEEKLPFPTDKLSVLLPKLDMTEKMARFGDSETTRLWPAALIRRLQQLGQLDRLPSPLELLVTEVKQYPVPSLGWIGALGGVGKIDFSVLSPKKDANAKTKDEAAVKKEKKIVEGWGKEVARGDTFRVEVAEVRLAERVVVYRAVERVGREWERGGVEGS